MFKKALIVIGIALLAGFGVSQVYAHGSGRDWGGGWGYGYMMGPGMMGPGMMGPGYGYGGQMMGPGYRGQGYGRGGYYGGNQQQADKWDKFYDETRNLRQELRQKYLEMDDLLSQKNPDQSKVLAKQKEISQLQAQLEEKELQFRLNNRDADDPGWGRYGMMGYGWGHGYMMGPGYGYYGHMMGPGYGGQRYGRGEYYGENKQQAEKWDKFYDETRGLSKELRQKYVDMDDLLSQKNPDESQVLAKQKEISQLQAQLEQKEIQFRVENRDVGGSDYGYCYGPGWNR
jgi:zinc resistance-associated protein